MSKVKNAVTFSAIFTKVIIGIAAAALVACIVLLSVKCAKQNKAEYYECEKYEWQYVNGTTPQVLDRLADYEYYRIYLNKDNTFTIKYIAKSDDVEREEKGTYTKKGSTYTLKYDSMPTQDLSDTIEYHLENGKLVREDRAVAPSGINYTIVQVFSGK